MTGPEHSRAKRRCPYMEVTSSGQKVDNSGSTLQKLFQLYRQADLCDVQLQVGVHLFHAHKLILSMSSDVFKTMLTDAKWPDARKARIVLNEEVECVKVFGEFLQYMYTGSIHLNNSTVLPVLTLADKYNIHDLGNVCRQYMLSHCHASLENLKVISWLQYAILCNDHHLEAVLRRYVELNFNHVMQSEDFLTMRADTLDEVLHCEHLVVHSEYSLFVGLKHWLLHNTGSLTEGKQSKMKSKAERKLTVRVMSSIRLPLIKHVQLLALQSDPFVQKHLDFFFPKLQAAWVVHMHPLSKGNRSLASQTSSPGSKKIYRHHSESSIVCFTSSSSSSTSNVSSCTLNSANHSVNRSGSSMCFDEVNAPKGTDTDEHWQVPISSHKHKLDSSTTSLLSSMVLGCGVRESSAYCHYMPRNYTCDDWSTCLTIEEFSKFPRYSSHTYFFSTPVSALPLFSSSPPMTTAASKLDTKCSKIEESDDSAMLEWQAELYPKGVRFPPAKMIGIPNNYDIDENCQDVVRLAVSSKTHDHQPCRVDISVLATAMGTEDGSEYMEALAHKTCIFDKEHTMHNIDNIVSFANLNHLGSKYLTESVAAPGSGRTCFKVVVIIKPTH